LPKNEQPKIELKKEPFFSLFDDLNDTVLDVSDDIIKEIIENNTLEATDEVDAVISEL
jgi:hypothetical protein